MAVLEAEKAAELGIFVFSNVLLECYDWNLSINVSLFCSSTDNYVKLLLWCTSLCLELVGESIELLEARYL